MKIRHYKLGDLSKRKKINRVLDITLLGMLLGVVLGAYSFGWLKANGLPLLGRVQIASAHERYGDWRSYPVLVNGTPEQNEKIRYAWEISGYDIEFIYVLNGENGTWEHIRIHDNSANTVGTDVGFGINSYFHPEIVNDERFWNDWKWQIDRTYQLWSGGVRFYGYNTKGILMEG